jgi:Fe-S cluster assembly iron-binding protein IscA
VGEVAATLESVRIEQVRVNRKQPQAGLRLAITGRENGAFVYDIQLGASGEERQGDIIVEAIAGLPIHIPLASAPYLDGITLDADLPMGAVRVENPNPLATPNATSLRIQYPSLQWSTENG